MSDATHRNRITENLAGPARLEAMTLRCGRDVRQRIEAAYGLERTARPQLSLGRFLAECVANGLPENLPPAGQSGADTDEIAIRIAERISEQIAERLAGIEAAVPVIADVLGNLAEKITGLDEAVNAIRQDTDRTRTLIESAVDGNESAES
jgi:hypothetical protein